MNACEIIVKSSNIEHLLFFSTEFGWLVIKLGEIKSIY